VLAKSGKNLSGGVEKNSEEIEKNSVQFVLPGAERISSAELAKRRAAEPLKPKVAQKPLVEGLFGELALFFSTPPDKFFPDFANTFH
jgi:hypothetical protein